MDNWDILYKSAHDKLNPRVISPLVEAGSVAAAIMTEAGNIYTGVCIDTACSLGMCAERNAAANMITNGENKIQKLVCVMKDGEVGMPCGACRELIMQLSGGCVEILTDYKTKQTVMLKDTLPDWWHK